MTSQPKTHDIIVLGGAFASSATALLLKRADPSLRVVIVERRAAFDRKVGESCIELSSWFLTRMLGLDHYLNMEQLPKYGLRFFFSHPDATTLGECSELGNKYQTRVPSYHVDRALLDEHVQGLAVAEGAELLRPARVIDTELREGGISTVEVETADCKRQLLTARWIVDGTGRAAWLARRLGLIETMPEHPTRSVWARYRNVRDIDGPWMTGRSSGGGAICSRALSTNHFTGPGWWVWVIPLPGGDTSVGVVWDDRIFSLPPGDSVSQRFETFMRSFPAGRELMQDTERLDDDLHALNGLPYRVKRIMGDGWAMVGDAAGFIDPFYSPGLDWAALTSAKTTSVILDTRKSEGAVAQRVARHNRDFTRGFDRWVRALYLDKYYYMGDAELMEVALRMEVSLYYFGIVTQPYRGGVEALEVPFAPAVSTPFYALMALVNRRLARLGRVRMAAGTWGRRNAGRRVLLGGFKLGASSLRWVPGALARLALLEIGSIPDRLAARGRATRRQQPMLEMSRMTSVSETEDYR